MHIDWRQHRVRLNSAGRVRCEPAWRLGPDWAAGLKDFDLWLVWAGKGVMTTDSGPIPLHPGVCFWMRPGARYEASQNLDDRLGVTFIHFDILDSDGQVITRELMVHESHDLTDIAYADAVGRRVAELYRVSHSNRPQAAGSSVDASTDKTPSTRTGAQPLLTAQTLLTALLQDIDSKMHACPGQPPGGTPRHHIRAIAPIVSMITESPMDTPPIVELARLAGYSPDHFARVFRAVTGQSPQDFVVGARIQRARQLLVESSLTITQVADALGYRDVYFFSRQFRAKTGMTPSECRKIRPRS